MRLSAPRIAPLADAEMDADQKELVAPMAAQGRVLNIFRTLARTPKAARGFLAWGNYILSRRNDLPPRQRELVILRVGFLCRSGYEWTQHRAIGERASFTEKQCMDLVYTVGQYTQVSMILNTFGVPLDAGQVLDPDLKGF